MIQIHTILVGQPQTYADARGSWRTAIYRTPVAAPIELGPRGLAGDQVADTDNHGSPDQAVCCHPLAHYAAWNADYQLADPSAQLGPGSVGENWALAGATEADVCVGDIFAVGGATVQVSGPRFPCTKQERKLGLPAFHRRTIETLRTGWYLRVLEPGTVQAGNTWALQDRPHPAYTIQRINRCGHHEFDPEFAQAAHDLPELAAVWKYIFHLKLTKQWDA
jgi:MOSC domain-containing protein YiiM